LVQVLGNNLLVQWHMPGRSTNNNLLNAILFL
jgi:hypothetical protein